MNLDQTIKRISQEIELRKEFEKRRAIRMGLDPNKVLGDRDKPVQQLESRRLGVGSG